jgi:hypothetical protein
MRIFLTKTLARFVRREGISDDALIEEVRRARNGLIDADLGGGLMKQRVAPRKRPVRRISHSDRIPPW